MDLAGQQRFARKVAIRRGDRGYAMAALLVSLSIMSVMLTVAMPAWKQMARREKEEELIFRGQQYARAIGLFQRRAGPGALPPNFDILVQQKFLRKKYKDPITNDDFQPLLAGQQGPGQQQPGAGRGGVNAPGTPVAVPGQTPATQAPGAGTTIAAEFVATKAGIGYLIWNSWELLQVDVMFVGIVTVGVLGLIATVLLQEIERKVIPWKAE